MNLTLNRKDADMKKAPWGNDLKPGDKIKLHSVSSANDSHGTCTVSKIRNYAKGQRVYITSEWGYGFMMWLVNMNYEKV